MEAFVLRCRTASSVPVVVLGSSVNGLSYVRSLSRRGVPVLCMDHTHGYAAASRFGVFLLLEIDSDSEEGSPGAKAADQAFDLLQQNRIQPVAFGSADEWQAYIAERSEPDHSPFFSIAPRQSTMESIIDKQTQYELASQLGIGVPPFANAADVLSGKVSWSEFPAIIKPRWSHIGRAAIGGKALFTEDNAALRAELNKLSEIADVRDYLVQGVLGGTDNCLYSYLGLYEPAGKEFIGMVKQKLRQYPPFLGDGSYDVTCIDEPLAEAARRLLGAMDYRGLVGVEFKRDPGSDAFGLIEINPRTVSTNQLAIEAGVDFPWLAYQIAVHLAHPEKMSRPKAPAGYHVGYHHVNEERDFKTFLIRKKQKELRFFEWFKSVVTAQSFALWKWSDPWPFLSMVGSKIVAGIGRKATRKLSRSRE